MRRPVDLLPGPLARRCAILALAMGAVLAVDRDFSIDSPGASLSPEGVVAVRGAVARLNGQLLLADAVRYDVAGDQVWASGNVVLRMRGVRISAARLGARPRLRSGDAWEVEAVVQAAERQITVHADHVEWHQQELVLHGVSADFGHGGVIGFLMPRMRVLLREERDASRSGPAEIVEGVELISPTATLSGVPVLWLPWMYRDFRLNYPWSRVRFGTSRRLGTFLRYWIGTDLPELAGWRTGIIGRADLNSRAGGGAGIQAHWSNEDFGRGEVWYFRQPAEKVRGGDRQRQELETREAEFVDAEHRARLGGPGAGALYLRAMRAPAPDPSVPGYASDANGLRWMSDYFPDHLEQRPYPGQNAALAYGIGAGTLVVDTSRSHQDEVDRTERWHGVQGLVPVWQVAGPVHLSGQVWEEDLHRTWEDTSANRVTWKTQAGASRWWGGFGADASGGLRGLAYHDGIINGIGQEPWQERRQGVADAGVSLRVAGRSDGWTHIVTPRIGVQLLGQGVGEDLPAYGFADPRDSLEEDKRYGTLGFTTSLADTAPVFRADVLSRWALRDEERYYIDPDGNVALADGRLVDVSGTAEGTLWRRVNLTASFLYDARKDSWRRVNAGASWLAAEWVVPRYEVTVVPTGEWDRVVEHGPGVALIANRYRLDGALVFSPGGASVEKYRSQLVRRMVDGDLSVGFDFIREPLTGAVYDRRLSVGFSLAGVEATGNQRTGYSF